jgi:hypothetical protein
MAHEGVIVRRAAGKTIDDEFLLLLATEYPDYIGFAAVNEGELVIDIKEGGEESSIQDIKDTMAAFEPEFTLIFGKGCTEEYRQPFNVTPSKEEAPICLLMLEGNFAGSGYEPKANETTPDEWHVAQDYLLPKITDLYETLNQDVGKMVEYLNKPFNQNEILKSICPLPRYYYSSTTARL